MTTRTLICLLRTIAFSGVVGSIGLNIASAATIYLIQPDEASSKDTLLYEGIDSNMEGSFSNLLGAAATTGHSAISLLEFDLSSLGAVNSSNIVSATLTVKTQPALFPYQDPTASFPVLVDVVANLGSWDETAVKWSTRPEVEAVPVSSAFASSSAGQLVTFDITSLMVRWLSGELTNNGLQLIHNAPVNNGSGFVGATFLSASAANPSDRPLLEVTAVPEPHTAYTAAMALAVFLLLAKPWRHLNHTAQAIV